MSATSFNAYFVRRQLKVGTMKSLNFAESNVHRKTNAHGSFETEFFGLALQKRICYPIS